jgi:hypothetical protein
VKCFKFLEAENYKFSARIWKGQLTTGESFSHSKQSDWMNWHFGEAVLKRHFSFPLSLIVPMAKEQNLFLRQQIDM